MELHPFNPKIREIYGQTLDGRPNYRIARRMREVRVYNSDGFEFNRLDNPFTAKTVEMRKYEYIPDDIWILEKLLVGFHNPELIESERGSYEPVYVFWWDASGPKDMSYKEPIWPAVKFLIELSIKQDAETAAHAKEADAKDFASRRAECRDALEEASPWIPSQIKEGYGIVVPNSYEKEEKCYPSPSSLSSQE